MAASTSLSSTVRALFCELIDYAGLFPPAQLAMGDALAEYRRQRIGSAAWMLGRFIVPLSRVEALSRAWPEREPLALSVILDGGLEDLFAAAQLRASQGPLRIAALEVTIAPAHIDALAEGLFTSQLHDLPAFVELAAEQRGPLKLRDAMRALKAHSLGAKIRCGGAGLQSFPSSQAVAEFISSACACGVPFKATAGLHHPLRHTDTNLGVKMHGFLNLLAASALAREGVHPDELIEVVECEDAGQIAIDDRGLRFGGFAMSAAQLQGMRREAFVAYGSCSFSEPVEDLRALALLA